MTMMGQYSVDFEGGGETKTSYSSANVTLNGVVWTLADVLIGTGGTDVKNGGRSARFNGSGTPVMTMNADVAGGIGTFTLKHAKFSSDGNSSFKVEYSTNGGTSWTQIGANTTVSTTTLATFSQAVNVSGNVRVRITKLSGTGNRFNIDDISWNAGGPSVSTSAATSIAATGATLNGSGNPSGTGTMTLSFEYGTTTSYGTTIAATPATSASSATFSAVPVNLTPNTTYNFRAVGVIGANTYNGSNATFLTLAAVPGVPVVNGATSNTLNITLNSTTQNNNPAATEYAIQEAGGQYVQANGALAATAVWQTAANWATKTVTGLAASTTYTFKVKARNSANTETAFGSTASGTTLANTTPTLTASTLNAFGAICINTTSSANFFILSGENLTPASTVTVGPLTGYTFSTTSTGSYGTTAQYTADANGAILADVFVKFTPTAVQSYNSNIPVSGGGASAITVAASGSGINTTATVTTTSVTVFAGTTATMGGNVTAQGCSTVTERGVVYATTTTPAIGGTGVTKLAAAAGGIGTYSVNATGLNGATQYYVRAYAISDAGTVYGSQVTFTTLCTTPVNVTALSATPASSQIALSWTNGSCSDEVIVVAKASSAVTAVPTGDGTAYTANAAFGSGTAIAANEFVVFKGTGTSVTVTGLINETPYYFTVFTRRGTTWSSGTSASATPTITYCSASSSTTSYEYIASVNFNGTTNSSGASNYTFYSTPSFSVERYLSYPLTVTLGGATIAADKGGLYIDWNRDGDFDDSGEVVYFTTGMGTGPYTATISVPATASLGNVRMRIRLYDSSATGESSLGACGTSSYGEVEDYILNIAAGTPPLAAPTALAATNIKPTGFDARWNAVAGATSYRLDVYQSTVSNATAAQPFNTGFSLPPDWTVTQINGTYTSSGNYGDASPALQLDTTGDILETPTYPAAATSLSFFLKSNGGTTSSLLIEGYNGTSWVTIHNYTGLPTSGTVRTYSASSTPALPANIVKFRFSFTKVAGNLAFDDLTVVYPSTNYTYLTGYQNKTITTAPVSNVITETVTGAAENTLYKYVVRAVSPTSVNSNEITVTTGRSNVWNGTTWTAGTPPTGTDAAIIQGNFNTGTNTGLTSVYDLTVNSGTLTIASGTTVTVTNQVKNNGGSIVAQNNGNLIQVNNVANTGNAVINRNSSPLFRQDYTMWSSPVAGQTLIGFSPNTLTNRFYTYNTVNDQFAAISASGTFEAGKGYLIRMPNGAFGTDGTTPAGTPTSTASAYQQGTDTMVFNGAFTGVPNNGNVDVTLTDALNGFNLVGNPYPSPINISTFLNANNSVIDGTVWIWRKTNSSTLGSAYVTVNAAGAYTGNGQPEAENPNSVLRQGQGFIVKVKDDNASNNITFTNAMRSSDTANQFFRNANAAAQMGAPERHGMRINLSKEGQIVSQLYAGYIEGATLGADNGIDSRYINDNANVLDMVIDGKEYIIQGRPLPFATEDIVPLNFKVAAAGTYSISLNDVEGLFANGQDIFIKDNLTGSIQNLNEGNYSFTADAGTAASRFEIVYTNSVLGTDNPSATLNNVVVYQNAAGINIAAGNLSINDVTVYDVQGRLVYTAKGVNASETVLKMQPAQQLLIIEVVTNAGKTTRKLVY